MNCERMYTQCSKVFKTLVGYWQFVKSSLIYWLDSTLFNRRNFGENTSKIIGL